MSLRHECVECSAPYSDAQFNWALTMCDTCAVVAMAGVPFNTERPRLMLIRGGEGR